MKSRNTVSKYPAVLFVPVAIIFLAFGVGIGIYWQGSQDRGVSNFYLLLINFKATLISNLGRIHESLDTPPRKTNLNSLEISFKIGMMRLCISF
jgi:hypothetical protein